MLKAHCLFKTGVWVRPRLNNRSKVCKPTYSLFSKQIIDNKNLNEMSKSLLIVDLCLARAKMCYLEGFASRPLIAVWVLSYSPFSGTCSRLVNHRHPLMEIVIETSVKAI